jgi:hypothetical protein
MAQLYNVLFLKDSLGSSNMAVDGSVTPVDFDIDFQGFSSIEIVKVNIYIEGGGNVTSYDDFLTIADGLTNGVSSELKQSDKTFQFTPIKRNAELLSAFRINQVLRKRNTEAGIGSNNSFIGTFETSGKGAVLTIALGDYYRFTINDDLSDLNEMHVTIEGNVI